MVGPASISYAAESCSTPNDPDHKIIARTELRERRHPDLRAALIQAAATARAVTIGIWGNDATTSGAQITTQDDLSTRLVLMPKLFRRLAEYFALTPGDPSLAQFNAFLASHNDRIYVISDGRPTGLDTVIDVNGDTVQLTKPITDLIFIEG
jgi:hypothetical protein